MTETANSRLATQVFILGVSGSAVGSGFICDDRHVMTCAHVVGDAVGQPSVSFDSVPPPERIRVRFAVNGHVADAEAVPEAWRPVDSGPGADVAVLRLIEGTIPAEAAPVKAAIEEPVTGEEYTGLGMVEDAPEGTPLNGCFRDYVSADRRGLDANSADRRVGPGCSGAAVFVLGKGGIAGMVVEMQQTATGLLLPVHFLRKVWKIEEHEAGRPAAAVARSPRTGMKRLLRERLLTFDREPQSADFGNGLDEVWRQERHPVVYLIGGLESDRPEICQDRCLSISLRQVLGSHVTPDRYVAQMLPWPLTRLFNEDRALAALKRGLAMTVGAPQPSAERIAQAWADADRPFFFFSDLAEKPWARHERLIRRWCDFLETIRAHQADEDEPIIHFLRIGIPDGRFRSGNDDPDEALRDYFDRLTRRLPPRVFRPLPSLEGFNDWLVEKWLTQMSQELHLNEDEASDLKAEARERFGSMGHARLRDLENWINLLS